MVILLSCPLEYPKQRDPSAVFWIRLQVGGPPRLGPAARTPHGSTTGPAPPLPPSRARAHGVSRRRSCRGAFRPSGSRSSGSRRPPSLASFAHGLVGEAIQVARREHASDREGLEVAVDRLPVGVAERLADLARYVEDLARGRARARPPPPALASVGQRSKAPMSGPPPWGRPAPSRSSPTPAALPASRPGEPAASEKSSAAGSAKTGA